MFGKFIKCAVLLQLLITIMSACGSRLSKGQLEFEQREKHQLSGAFYPDGNSSKWYIVFSVQADEFNIVSKSDIFFAPKVFIIPFIRLKLPTRYQNSEMLSKTRQEIVRSVRDSFKVYKATKTRLPIDELFEAYEDFVVELFKAVPHKDNEINEIALSLMYHSTIVTSVRRITEGAVSDDDICQEPPLYGDNLFMCSQELETMMPRDGRHKRRVRSIIDAIKKIIKAIRKKEKTKRPPRPKPKPTRQPPPRTENRNEWSGSGSAWSGSGSAWQIDN